MNAKIFNSSDYQYRSAKTVSVMRCSGRHTQELQRTQPHPLTQHPNPFISFSSVQNTSFSFSTNANISFPKKQQILAQIHPFLL